MWNNIYYIILVSCVVLFCICVHDTVHLISELQKYVPILHNQLKKNY